MAALALDGLRVVDFSRLLPGPYASLVLADLGADVIKVEEVKGGDYLRFMPPLTGKLSSAFHALNSGKRSLAVDLKQPEGAEVVRRLAAGADVLLESFRPGVLARLGLGYAQLAADNPRLIYCAVTGYGQDGPWRDRAGHDLNYLATAGVTATGGPADRPPIPMPVQVADIGGGSLWALVGVLTALYERERTGRGQLVDVSMTDGSLGFMTAALAPLLGAGQAPPARGRDTLTGGQPCYQVYATADGRFISVGALEPKFWAAFCKATGRPDLLGKQFAGQATQAAQIAEVAALFATKTRDEWAAIFAGADACVEPVLELHELVDHPLHVARGNFVVDARGNRRVRTPLRPKDAPAPGGAPGLGEHTAEILAELGYDAATVAALAARGVIGGVPK